MPDRDQFYARAIAALKRAKVPFLVGGAFALRHYTGIERETKDIDFFLREEDCSAAMRTLGDEGYRTELTDPVWLAKAFDDAPVANFIDLIFNSGNGLSPIDDLWFSEASKGLCYGQSVCFVPPEEMIVSKAFIMARDRYDGADIAHLLLLLGEHLDWNRLLWRFGTHWRVLLSHLVLFSYIYPFKTRAVPERVVKALLQRAEHEAVPVEKEPVCRGENLNKLCYAVDTHQWGYRALQRAG